MYVMLRLVEERGEGVCVHVFIHWQQATILWLCKLKNDTVLKKKSFFLILFTYQNLKILHFNKTHTLISESLVSQNIEKYTFPYF